MNSRHWVPLLLLASVLAAIACLPSGAGSERALTLEEYFEELRRIGDESRALSAPISTALEGRAADLGDDPSEKEVLSLLSEFYREAIPMLERGLKDMRLIKPPPEVGASHGRLIQSIEDGIAELETVAERLASADSVEEVRDLFEVSFAERLGQLMTSREPCIELQDIAIEHDIEVNLACRNPDDWDNPLEITRRPEFLTPVAQAQDARITPYWMGKEFKVGAITVVLTRDIEVYSNPSLDPAFSAAYSGRQEEPLIHIGLNVTTWHEGAAELANRRQRVLDQTGATTAPVKVGDWPAELVSVPGGTRPIRALFLYIDVGDFTVGIITNSGTTGVPGTDSNPLLDSQLFIDTVAAHLQPYSP